MAFGPQQSEIFPDHGFRQTELLGENSLKFLQYLLANEQLVVGDDTFEQFGTQTARGDRARQHVGVDKYSHETSRKTSSSVR